MTIKMYKFVSKDSESIKWFTLNYILCMVNIGGILPFQTHSVGGETTQLFGRQWYMNVSSSVGLAIFMQFALYYFLVICRYLSQLAMRLWDRGCKLGLASPTEGKDEANEDDEEEEELARSKQMTQA